MTGPLGVIVGHGRCAAACVTDGFAGSQWGTQRVYTGCQHGALHGYTARHHTTLKLLIYLRVYRANRLLATPTVTCKKRWRRESNPCARLCRPLPHHSATPPLGLMPLHLRADDGI